MRFALSAVYLSIAVAFSTGALAATYATPIIANGSNASIVKDDPEIEINVTSGDDAVLATNGGKVVLGGEQTNNIAIYADTGYDAVSAWTSSIDGTRLDIQANQSVEIKSEAFGLWAQSGHQDASTPDNSATINITADRISIDAVESTIVAYSNSRVNLKANYVELNSASGTAIDVRGNSVVNVGNADGTGVVVINGDVVFETPNQSPDGNNYNSGDKVNAYVNINLNKGSSWTGRAYQYFPVKNESGEWEGLETVNLEDDRDQHYGFVTGFVLNIEDGAVWKMTGDSFVNTATVDNGGSIVVTKDVAVVNADKLTLSGGSISLQGDAAQQLNVNTLSGTGGTVDVATSVDDEGTLMTPKIQVKSVVADTATPMALAVNYKGITSDHLTAENTETLKALSITEGSATITEVVQEGDINGVWERETLADGTSSVTQAANTKLTDFSSVNAMSLVQWRNEINHLTKRLGDIRASEGTIGAWARVYGGESQWGGANEVEMDHTTIQVGGDYRINNHWIAGAAFSYTDSRADLANGDADGDSYSLAVYGTYTADGGSFLDVIGRYGYLKNDITAGNMALDTSSSAFSLSAEMGHTFRFINDAAYVEPQIEFTYGFISGDDATASNGVRIDQDDFQSFVTRVGVRAGYDFPQKKGSVYGMFSYSYDWMGDADGTASKDGLRQALSQDLGGGWVTYGVGAQIMLGDSAYFYGELERTSGGDIDNPYLFSAGVRMTF